MSTKSQKILAAYQAFAQRIASIPDPKAQELFHVASGVARFVAGVQATKPHLTPSQIASGLEQGLRELPELIGAVDIHWRWALARALHDAIAAEYPDALLVDAQQLRTIVARGEILTKSEFHLVRYRIDVLEAMPELDPELTFLHALASDYEARNADP